MNSLYIKGSLALIDFTTSYYDTIEELLNSDDFKMFLEDFIEDLKIHDHELASWMIKDREGDEITNHIIGILKAVTVISLDEGTHIKAKDTPKFLDVVEKAYHFWRNKHRYSLIYSQNESGLLLSRFLGADMRFNELIISLYRMIQEKVQGYRNSVYRQLQAGTNGSLFLNKFDLRISGKYQMLNSAYMIQKVMMRSPIIINLEHNKRIGTFTKTNEDPLSEYRDYSDFFCFPIYVGSSLTYVYFHKDFTASAIGLANLFEFAPYDKLKAKPDAIILFGVEDGKEETVYYYDEDNDIYVGKISYMPIIEYFGYFKKLALTLHNLVMINKGYLPIHGAMLNLYLKNGSHKGVCLMGDSGAGKSETIEALNRIGCEIEKQELIFDDMGSMYINEKGEVVCIGTEIGAFVRLDDLDAASAYKDLDRSIFFNPGNTNSRVITPASTYQTIIHEHKVDIFLYANNYDDKRGINIIDDVEEAKKIYVEGKRFALGTTNEKGLSSTYFANPFGPMQEKEKCDVIIDKVFKALKENHVLLGEIYSNLGLKNKGDGGINIAARELLELIKK